MSRYPTMNDADEWRVRSDAFMEHIAARGHEFTSDDHNFVVGYPDTAHGANARNSAIGAVFPRARRDGLIEPTGRSTKSRAPSRKGGRVEIWRGIVSKIPLKEQIRSCTSCELHEGCEGPVPYRGRRSKILILGEAPGRLEDQQGRPFVGQSGKMVWTELFNVGIEREEVFACNTVSCYPHGTPTPQQAQACRGNLYSQVRLCNPTHLLALGLTANRALGNDKPMGKMHGMWYPLRWFSSIGGLEDEISVMPTYHPAAVLRDRTLTRAFRADLREFANGARGVE